MQNNKREVEINGKFYTLSVKRSILFRIASIAPELLKINQNSKKGNNSVGEDVSQAEKEVLSINAMEKLYDNMNIIFYEMLRERHPEITLEKSNEIYYNFCNEYNDVDDKLFSLIETVFTQGIPRENKKNLNW